MIETADDNAVQLHSQQFSCKPFENADGPKHLEAHMGLSECLGAELRYPTHCCHELLPRHLLHVFLTSFYTVKKIKKIGSSSLQR